MAEEKKATPTFMPGDFELAQDRPQGTLEELREANLDPSNWGSCSLSGSEGGPRNNKGCPLYRVGCPAPQFRDGKNGRKGPCNIGVAIVLSPVDGGAADGRIMRCYDWHFSGLKDRRRQAYVNGTGEIIQIIAFQGDSKAVKMRGTERLHPKPVPGCLSCASPEGCLLMKDVITETPVPPAPRLSDKVSTTYGSELRDEMLRDLERQAMQETVEKHQEMGTGGA